MTMAWWWILLLMPVPWIVGRWFPAVDVGDRLDHPLLARWSAGRAQASGNSRRQSRWLWLVWALLLLALARPQTLGPWVEPEQPARAIMMVVDLSRSMEEPDMEWRGQRVRRYQAVQQVVGDFARERRGDALGLVVCVNCCLTFCLAWRETARPLAMPWAWRSDDCAISQRWIRLFYCSRTVRITPVSSSPWKRQRRLVTVVYGCTPLLSVGPVVLRCLGWCAVRVLMLKPWGGSHGSLGANCLLLKIPMNWRLCMTGSTSWNPVQEPVRPGDLLRNGSGYRRWRRCW